MWGLISPGYGGNKNLLHNKKTPQDRGVCVRHRGRVDCRFQIDDC
jgi:hypothetical protein